MLSTAPACSVQSEALVYSGSCSAPVYKCSAQSRRKSAAPRACESDLRTEAHSAATRGPRAYSFGSGRRALFDYVQINVNSFHKHRYSIMHGSMFIPSALKERFGSSSARRARCRRRWTRFRPIYSKCHGLATTYWCLLYIHIVTPDWTRRTDVDSAF